MRNLLVLARPKGRQKVHFDVCHDVASWMSHYMTCERRIHYCQQLSLSFEAVTTNRVQAL